MERKGRVWFWRVWAVKQKMKLFFESHLSRIGISRFQGTAAVSEPVASPLSTDVPDAIKDYTMLRRMMVASCMILHWVWMSLPQAAESPRDISPQPTRWQTAPPLGLLLVREWPSDGEHLD